MKRVAMMVKEEEEASRVGNTKITKSSSGKNSQRKDKKAASG